MDDTANLKLPYIMAAQAQKHVTHNEAIRALDAIVQLGVIDRDLTVPPASPTNGERYIVAVGATGAWAGKDGQIAAWQENVWMFYGPQEGWLAWVSDEGQLYAWSGTAWVQVSDSDMQNIPMLGLNTTADVTNRLAVSSPATLFSHEGNGHQIKVNKNAAADTASLLFQTGWSGRAEMGTAGNDDFSVKVSPDGAAWNEAMVIDKDTGNIGFGTITPQAKVHCVADNGRAFLMTGDAADGSGDSAHGAMLVLSHNSPGNRQFSLADSDSGNAVRFIGSLIDGYNFLTRARQILALGTSTHGIRVNGATDAVGPVIGRTYIRPASFTAATMPSAATSGAGAMIYVSDEAGGAVPAFSDGSNWRRMTDRAVVS
ncbi:MAG TPA: hypothetical protein DD979_18745 [Gammaproteobacteria bacterium]|jgi:hypothetical protein|nr:hypothetical protein [Gammaproteobacteria bacterium]